MTDETPASVGPIRTMYTNDEIYVRPYPADDVDRPCVDLIADIGEHDTLIHLNLEPAQARALIDALTLCVGLVDPLRPVTRWMARYAGLPAAPGPAHAIRTPDPGTPACHSPVTYCGIVAMNSGFPSRVTWQNVTEPGHERRCAKCDRQVAVDQSS